jgi:hypothetical protein
MGTLDIRIEPLAVDVSFSPDALHVVLADGREVSAPLPDKTPTLDELIEYAKQLSAFDKLRLVEELIPDVKATIAQAPLAPLKSAHGALADLGTAPSAEDIEQSRREMFQDSPRTDVA